MTPRRQKFDRLMDPAVTGEALSCSYAVAPFDEASRRMDVKWGAGRLPGLATPETAVRFGSAMAKLNAAISAGDAGLAAHKAKVCIKGLNLMDAEAEAAGAAKADPTVWTFDHDGFHFGIIKDADCWQAATAANPDLRLYTLAEIGTALRAYSGPVIDAVKETFPGAQITKITPKADKPPVNYDLGGDEIPF